MFKHAGTIRDYTITQPEWVLEGDTVQYGIATELRPTLEYDLGQEKAVDDTKMRMDEVVEHIARFTSGIW